MKLPFVSRTAYELALEVIANLKEQLKEERTERRQAVDIIGIKSAGVSIFGEVKVPVEVEEPEPRKYSPEKDSPDGSVPKVEEEIPLTRARDVVNRQTKVNRDAFDKHLVDQQRLARVASQAVILEMVAEGQQAADASHKV